MPRRCNGAAGSWLLDPYDLTVTTSSTTATQSPPGTYTAKASGNIVLNTDIDTALNGGTSVVLQTSGSLGDGQGNGDISVESPIQMTGSNAASLTLKAGGSILINQSISSTGGALALTLDSNTLGGGGYVSIGAPITTNGGALVIGGGGTPLTQPAVGTAALVSGVTIGNTLSTGGGAITINGAGYGGSGSGNDNFGVAIYSGIDAGGGSIAITGTGGASTGSDNYGISQTGTIITTGSGSINLNGTGGSGIDANGYYGNVNITAGTGNISITGVGTASGSGIYADGIELAGGTISTAGTGTITLNGSVSGTSSEMDGSDGVNLNNTAISAVDGLISITGTNTAATTGSVSTGVYVADQPVQSSGAGGITIMGTAGGAGSFGNAIGVFVTSPVSSTGSGTVSISGTGGDSGGTGSYNYGVGIDAAISAAGGAISITGTGGNSSGSNNHGINQSAAVTNTGNGSITLYGMAGASGTNGIGYYTTSNVTAATGNISITGEGGIQDSGSGVLGFPTISLRSGSGDIGASGTPVIINAANLTAQASNQDIYLSIENASGSALTIGSTANPNIGISAGTGNVTLNLFDTPVVQLTTAPIIANSLDLEVHCSDFCGTGVSVSLPATGNAVTQPLVLNQFFDAATIFNFDFNSDLPLVFGDTTNGTTVSGNLTLSTTAGSGAPIVITGPLTSTAPNGVISLSGDGGIGAAQVTYASQQGALFASEVDLQSNTGQIGGQTGTVPQYGGLLAAWVPLNIITNTLTAATNGQNIALNLGSFTGEGATVTIGNGITGINALGTASTPGDVTLAVSMK